MTTTDIGAAINDALEWQDFLTYCERNKIAPAEDDHETWRATFEAWLAMRNA